MRGFRKETREHGGEGESQFTESVREREREREREFREVWTVWFW